MSNYPMVDEVNRLVGNLLAGGSGVFLPGVGSLFVERRGARRLSKRSVQPPCRVVSFSSQQQGVSLADELARTLHCDRCRSSGCLRPLAFPHARGRRADHRGRRRAQIQEFYACTRVRQAAKPAGARARADQACPPLDWALWVGIAAIVIAAGFGGAEFLRINSSDIPEPGAAAEVARTLPAADAGFPPIRPRRPV